MVLTGKISGLTHQAQLNSNGVPMFMATVDIANYPKEYNDVLHVGMSAKVEVDPEEINQISIPLQYVKENDEKFFVRKWDDKTKKFIEAQIQAGTTTQQSVLILSGLTIGDKIARIN